MWFSPLCALALAGSTLLSDAAGAQGGVRSTVMAAAAPLDDVKSGSIGITVNSGAVQALGSVTDNAVNPFPGRVNLTLTWDLHPSTGAVAVVGYFSNPAQAMVSGPVAVPSGWLLGRVPTPAILGAPTTFTPFTHVAAGSAGTAGGSLTLVTQPVLGYSRSGTLSFDLELQLDLTGRVLTPGVYAGTLNLRAVTQ